MADRHHHVFLRDQVFVILINGMITDFSAAGIPHGFTRCPQFLKDHFDQALAIRQDQQVITDGGGQILGFIGQFFAFHPGQALQPQLKDGLGLNIGKLVFPIHDSPARFIDQRNERRDFLGWPLNGCQLTPCGFGIRGLADQLNHRINAGQGDHQASQNMGAVTGLAQQMTCPPGHDFLTEGAEGPDHLHNAHLFGLATIQHQQVHGKG